MADTDTIVRARCCECHSDIHMPSGVLQRLRESHQKFWCLNGHVQWFAGSTPTERERDAASARAERLEREAKTQRERAERAERELRLNRNACKHCPKKFETPEALQRHVRRVHQGGLKRLPANAGESN